MMADIPDEKTSASSPPSAAASSSPTASVLGCRMRV